ncbi:MAG: MobA/MobL family protein [Paracoccus sp.]|nr:MobA/MobL family protein [Paracoccus sp. (in: a-proteobacteria)]
MISRSAGRSATAAAAYRSAELIVDQRTGLSFDYRARGGVDHVETLAPADAPTWVQDRAALWNAVELAETRKNSQVAREVRVALPCELDAAQRLQLVRDFCQREFVDRGMVADIALHAPGREGDERNHHAHILLTTREIGPEGFTTKNRDWNAKELLEGWREAWARDTNHALERCGAEERVDHRTLEAQRVEAQERALEARERGDEAKALRETVRAVALDRQPLPQLSAGAWQLKERGIEVAAVQIWREIKEQAVEVARVAQELADKARVWLERVTEQVRDVVERVAPADAWGEFFAAAAPGASAAAEGLARDLETERRQEAQREAAEREAQEKVQEQERRAHERDRGDDHGW